MPDIMHQVKHNFQKKKKRFNNLIKYHNKSGRVSTL